MHANMGLDPAARHHPSAANEVADYREHRARQRRPAFYNSVLYEISFKIQNPDLITFRDTVAAILAVYYGYRGFLAVCAVHKLLLRDPMHKVCFGKSALGCLWKLMWMLMYILGGWIGHVIPWVLLAVLVVFFGEEVIRYLRRR
ncbi:hypothetical protein B0H67DRAFT_109190 [Lasiosphaeris hirsuta]|uniref:Uncharacterized protein n=1 Tax=Lasiosphaeris hirsuta TaxID=260670 RepID=A0AA40AZ17_9PEZI|nr:hypothetical protein B0H67DRAFT_109190 [Lasiosphaeris hirsuta]